MLDNYMSNFNTILSSALYIGFKIVLIVLVFLLILSLILLAIGCLIKSQKIKSKFLKIVPGLLFSILLFLLLPIIFVHFKNMI